MTDNMDKLLFDMGQRANEEVDFSRTLSLLLKEQEKQRKRKAMMYRCCGAAAAMLVLLLGVTSLMPGTDMAKTEAAPAAEAPMEYAVAEASMAADTAVHERTVLTEEAAAESAEAEAVAEEAPAPSSLPASPGEDGAAGIPEYPAEEEAYTGGAPLAPAEDSASGASQPSAPEAMLFEGVAYVSLSPLFHSGDIQRLGLPANISPEAVGEELGSAVSQSSGEPFPVYAYPGAEVSGVLILGGDSYLVPQSMYAGQ